MGGSAGLGVTNGYTSLGIDGNRRESACDQRFGYPIHVRGAAFCVTKEGDVTDSVTHRYVWDRGELTCQRCGLPIDPRRDVEKLEYAALGDTRPSIVLARHGCGQRIRVTLFDQAN